VTSNRSPLAPALCATALAVSGKGRMVVDQSPALAFRVSCLGFRVSGLGFWVSVLGCRGSDFEFRDSDFGIRIQALRSFIWSLVVC